MPETTTLHFDLRHVSQEQPVLRRRQAALRADSPHAGEPRARAGPTRHWTGSRTVGSRTTRTRCTCPAAPLLLRVTAPALAPDEPLDRLVLTGIHLPRRYRVEGLQRRRRRGQDRPAPSTGRSAGRGAGDPFPVLPDKVVIDAGDLCTPLDAAHSLVFHHAELLTTQAGWAADIVYVITTAAGINDLADAIARQAKAHEQDPNQPNWVTSRPGTDWRTGQPTTPIYVWSDETLEYLRQPLWDTLQATKDDARARTAVLDGPAGDHAGPDEHRARRAGRARRPRRRTTRSRTSRRRAVSTTPSPTTSPHRRPRSASRTTTCVGCRSRSTSTRRGPATRRSGRRSRWGRSRRWTRSWRSRCRRAGRRTRSPSTSGPAGPSSGSAGWARPRSTWSYDELGIICTAVFNYAVPTLFIALGVAADQGGKAWTGVCKEIADEWAKASPFVEAVAEGPLGGAVSGGVASTTSSR